MYSVERNVCIMNRSQGGGGTGSPHRGQWNICKDRWVWNGGITREIKGCNAMGGSFFRTQREHSCLAKPSVFEQESYSSEFPLQCSLPGSEARWTFERMTKNSHIQIELPRKAFIQTSFFLSVSSGLWMVWQNRWKLRGEWTAQQWWYPEASESDTQGVTLEFVQWPKFSECGCFLYSIWIWVLVLICSCNLDPTLRHTVEIVWWKQRHCHPEVPHRF